MMAVSISIVCSWFSLPPALVALLPPLSLVELVESRDNASVGKEAAWKANLAGQGEIDTRRTVKISGAMHKGGVRYAIELGKELGWE